METFDTIVVGKGMLGAAAARYLAADGASVALVGPDEPSDFRTHSGVFASHYDSGRITRTIDKDPDWALLARRSIARYREIEARSGIAFFNEVGCLIASPATSDFMARTRAASREVGADAADLDAEALRDEFPSLRFPPGYVGLHEVRGAGTIDARMLVRAQTHLAEAAGARVVTAVVAAVHDRGSHAEIVTQRGDLIRGANVLVATGAFSIDPMLLPRPLDLRVRPRTVLFADLGPEDADRYADMSSVIRTGRSEQESFYVLPPVRYPDGTLRIKIGGDPVHHVLDRTAWIADWYRTDGSPEGAAHLRRHLEALLPDLRPVAWGTKPCVTTYTRSGHPYIGPAGSERVIALTGGNGQAAKSSDEIGRLGALVAAGRSLDQEGYRCDFAPCFT